MKTVRRTDLIYPELSYKIMGCAFEVNAQIGSGHYEKVYQRALKETFRKYGLLFKEQVYYPVRFEEKIIGRKFLDFLVEGMVVVEIKKGNRYSKANIDQVLGYLKQSN